MVHCFTFRWFERIKILFGARCYFCTESDVVRCATISVKRPLWVGETEKDHGRLPGDPRDVRGGLA
jgi:hypothetical protein